MAFYPGLARKSWSFYRKANLSGPTLKRAGLLSAYALAVSEENASGGVIVTAPTCGSCGIVPAVLYYLKDVLQCSDETILRALATAGDELVDAIVAWTATGIAQGAK